jgi:hypothetical protein
VTLFFEGGAPCVSNATTHNTTKKRILSLAFKVFLPWNGVVGSRYPALDGEVVLDTRSMTSTFAATCEPSKKRVTSDPKLGYARAE